MMSDCIKCWDTPCTCGYGYRDWSVERLRTQIEMLQGVLEKAEKPKQPSAMASQLHMERDSLRRGDNPRC